MNTSSIFGLNGYPGWCLYVATKHAVTRLTKAAALGHARQNIRVNAVGPGPVETPLLAKGTGGLILARALARRSTRPGSGAPGPRSTASAT